MTGQWWEIVLGIAGSLAILLLLLRTIKGGG